MASGNLNEGIVEYLYKGGEGSEAIVEVQLRTQFPGIGGTIITNEGAVTAFRKEKNLTQGAGRNTSLRHTLVKKLEDFFYRTGVYKFAHVPRPLGSVSLPEQGIEAYMYEWAYGCEGFNWEIPDYDNPGTYLAVKLKDFARARGAFDCAGVDFGFDVTDTEDGKVSQNIIHQMPKCITLEALELNILWKRIDYGSRSLPIRFDQFRDYISDHRSELVDVLRQERVEMMENIVDFLTIGADNMSQFKLGQLELQIQDYRKHTLWHYTQRGSGIDNRKTTLGPRTETLH